MNVLTRQLFSIFLFSKRKKNTTTPPSPTNNAPPMHRVRPLHGNFCVFETRLVSVSVWEKKEADTGGWKVLPKRVWQGGGAGQTCRLALEHDTIIVRVVFSLPSPFSPFSLQEWWWGDVWKIVFFILSFSAVFHKSWGGGGLLPSHTVTRAGSSQGSRFY